MNSKPIPSDEDKTDKSLIFCLFNINFSNVDV